MTVINLNLDKKFGNVQLNREVVAGEKKYNLVFNDEMYQKIADLQIAEVSLLDQLEKRKDDFVDKMNVTQRQEFLHSSLDKALINLEESLDTILGKGEGKRLYKYYGESTYMLSRVAEELIKLNDKINGDQEANFERKKKAVRDHYTKNSKKRG
ncbi:hypothetical protein [Limosilactobacillus caecicola]|uniref:hypothetical protein n=1 Tax=Limosilactobacillus caecicola TaxID=2941332 RepID=UPI00203ED8A4|nr:hypothetical protein [Limosilactobacillus caecicola]